MKKKNKSEREIKIKKQLVATGVYIALAAAVLGITSNSVKNILHGTQGYEIPDPDVKSAEIKLPELDTDIDISYLPKQSEHIFPDQDRTQSVSEIPEGINAEIVENTEIVPDNTQASGEPDDVTDAPSPIDITGRNAPSVTARPATGYISREFSGDELLYTPTMNDFRTHGGIDIAADIGSPVCSFADGIVSDIYDDPFMGTTVVISHSGSLVSSYSNLSPDLPREISVGATVTVGQVIGGIGETAIIESADIPHLHFELYRNEECINPEEYLS